MLLFLSGASMCLPGSIIVCDCLQCVYLLLSGVNCGCLCLVACGCLFGCGSWRVCFLSMFVSLIVCL